MTDIRAVLCHFIRLNELEHWVPAHDALQQLQEWFPTNLIPGLIECLEDGNSDVRHLAVQLLAEAKTEPAIPAMIERLTDEDWLVQVVVIFYIKDFGPQAAGAIPYVEPWLNSPNEYLRLLAATAIVTLDPDRTDLLPCIWDVRTSDNPGVSDVASEFFGECQ
jgi:HEAT repeat protein